MAEDITLMAETTSPTPTADASKPKRTSGSIRKGHTMRGAFLIEFEKPAQPLDLIRRQVAPGLQGPLTTSGKERQSAIDQYRTMERKGFRVTKDIGCLIPDEQYATYQKGATFKGHQRSFTFFGCWCPKQEKGATAVRNEHGWPANLQISHLCHRRRCCRIDHIIAEEQWRNIKRNFCGASGKCDCGNPIECLRRYQTEEQAEDPELCTTVEEVQAALDGAPKFKILNPEHYTGRDRVAKQRKQNREKRKRAGDKSKHAGERKRTKLAKRLETVVEGEEGAHEKDSDFM